MAKKQFESNVGDGKYRLTRYKGQIIGVEIWPRQDDPGKPQAYLVFKFPYKPPPRWWSWVRRAPSRR